MNSATYILFQHLVKRKQKKQVEFDKCAFEREHIEESHIGGSLEIFRIFLDNYFSTTFLRIIVRIFPESSDVACIVLTFRQCIYFKC